MDFFFPEDDLQRMTPEETHITSLTAEPYPDGERVRVDIGMTPFQTRPYLEVTLTDANGGEVARLDGNAHLGKGAHMVAEADESDSSFLHLKPFYTVITNVEMEHLDHFKTFKRIKDAYNSFVRKKRRGKS